MNNTVHQEIKRQEWANAARCDECGSRFRGQGKLCWRCRDKKFGKGETRSERLLVAGALNVIFWKAGLPPGFTANGPDEIALFWASELHDKEIYVWWNRERGAFEPSSRARTEKQLRDYGYNVGAEAAKEAT